VRNPNIFKGKTAAHRCEAVRNKNVKKMCPWIVSQHPGLLSPIVRPRKHFFAKKSRAHNDTAEHLFYEVDPHGLGLLKN